MSTVDSTPPEVSNRTGGIVSYIAGRATCSVDDQVGDATYGQEEYIRRELTEH